jgi:prepilin-type N-terminal cleavage/methylation domain-containing protein
MKFLQSENGLTLIETMITMAVVAIVLLGIMIGNTVIQQASTAAFERTRAVQAAHQVVESIRKTAQSGTFPANVLAEYPDGQEVEGITSYENNARVVVSYTDTNGEAGLANDSYLNVNVNVTWLENGRRAASTDLKALVTQR